jgi:RNA polymerase-binding transcription factor DksA
MEPQRPAKNRLDRRRAIEADRAALASQVERLEAVFGGIVESSELVATDDEHDPEGHTIAFERQQVAGLLRAARARLKDLDAALKRVDDGTDGTCATCGGRIADERLEAIPGTAHCIECV